jgi:hypothetical protein
VKKVTSTLVALAAAIVVTGAALAGTTAHKPIAFAASFTGNATTQSSDNVVTINANGKGIGSGLGAARIIGTGTGDSSKQPCVPFTGTGKMTGASGTLAFKVVPGSTGCGDEQGQVFSVSGKATVLKGTGAKLAGAKGTLRMSGTYDRSSGAFSVKFFGTLTR